MILINYFPGLNLKLIIAGQERSNQQKMKFLLSAPIRYLSNSYFTPGFGGNGFTFSHIAAEIITDLILGKENTDAKIFAFERV